MITTRDTHPRPFHSAPAFLLCLTLLLPALAAAQLPTVFEIDQGYLNGFVAAPATDEHNTVFGFLDEQRTAAKGAIEATQLTYAEQTWQSVAPQIDAYAAELAHVRTEACESHQKGKHSERLYDLRTACLDQRQAALAGLVEVLVDATPETVERLGDAVASLPPLARCSDAQALHRRRTPRPRRRSPPYGSTSREPAPTRAQERSRRAHAWSST